MKHGLGRGMFALVDENELKEVDKSQVNVIDIQKIMPNRYQPRKNFDEESLKELADSIKEKGVIQPVIVTDLGNGRYELVAGERRLRASRMAGLIEIPVIIKDFSDEDKIEIALIENIQREDLNPIEEAMAFKEIIEKLNINQDELAKKIGKNRSSIANTLRLLKLPETIREKVIKGEITEGHARAVMMLEDVDKMILFTNYIIENGLSVREAERDVKDFEEKPKKNVSRETKKRDNSMIEIEERFVQSIGAKVEIKGSQAKGKIEIHYFSKQELENIYRLISAKKN
jgi:ParB family transcriptional regulator, chromosome partitioning protein